MKIIGELFLIFLLLITNGRIFFIKKAKHDSLVVLAPICLLLSILQFFAWGMEITVIATFLLALLVFFSNFHAMFRYSENLYIDHYSPLMYFWSIITTITGTLLLAAVIYFLPVEIQNKKIGVEETKILFSGNFRSGFADSPYSINPSLTVHRYEKMNENISKFADNSEVTIDGETSLVKAMKNRHKKNNSDDIFETPPQTVDFDINEVMDKNQQEAFNKNLEEVKNAEEALANKPVIKNIIIFLPDKTADTFYYQPYLQFLAKDGYTVYSGDFFAKDCRWMHSIADHKVFRRTVMALEKALSEQHFSLQKEFYTYNISLECKTMLKIVQNYEKSLSKESENIILNYYFIGDEMSSIALKDFYNSNKTSFESKNQQEKLAGYFLINSISSYKTPGFGCIIQTDPLLAAFLGQKRDYSTDDIKLMVKETAAFIEKNENL